MCAAGAEPAKADLIVVDKANRTLSLSWHGEVFKVYGIALGGNPVGPKRVRGDQKTPEGEYVIDGRYLQTRFHRALHISYPNAVDRKRARQQGVDPGDAILIHGLPYRGGKLEPLHRLKDWTLGCIAVTNLEVEEIWRLVPDGTRILIKP